ncbi:MAG: hypothetical protein WCH21_08820 [Bacteroidota bacterium]
MYLLKNIFKNRRNNENYILVEEEVFVETDSIGWYQTYLIKQYVDDGVNCSNERIKKALTYFFLLSLLMAIAQTPAHAAMISASKGNNSEIKGKLYFFYTQLLNHNSVHHSSGALARVSTSFYTNSVKTNIHTKMASEEDILFLAKILSTTFARKSTRLIKTIRKVSSDSLNFSYFKNNFGIIPLFPHYQIERIKKSGNYSSFLKIMCKEVERLILIYTFLKSGKTILDPNFLQKQENGKSSKHVLFVARAIRNLTPEEEIEFDRFVEENQIETSSLNEKELDLLKNKWRRWRHLLFLMSYILYIWSLGLKKIRRFKLFCKEFIKKNPYVYIGFKMILFTIIVLFLYYYLYLKKVNRLIEKLIEKNVLILSQLNDRTKDFQKKLLEILGENEKLKKLLESCNSNSDHDRKVLMDKLAQVSRRCQALVDEALNRNK